MKYRDLAEIGLKLLEIYAGTQFLASLPAAFAMRQNLNFYQTIDNEFMGEVVLGAFSKIVLAATSTSLLYLFFCDFFPDNLQQSGPLIGQI